MRAGLIFGMSDRCLLAVVSNPRTSDSVTCTKVRDRGTVGTDELGPLVQLKTTVKVRATPDSPESPE